MTRHEYLNEIKEGLTDRLPEAEIADILSEYESFFEAGKEEGRDEQAVAESLGSPALLVRQVLEGRENEPKRVEPRPQSGFIRRVAAYIIDAFCAALPAILVGIVIGVPVMVSLLPFYPVPVVGVGAVAGIAMYSEERVFVPTRLPDGTVDMDAPFFANTRYDGRSPLQQAVIGLSFAFYLLYAPVTACMFGGQTLGKRLLKLAVAEKGGKLSIRRIIAREFLIKTLLNSIPIVALFSIFSVIFDKDHRAIHDRILGTQVVEAK